MRTWRLSAPWMRGKRGIGEMVWSPRWSYQNPNWKRLSKTSRVWSRSARITWHRLIKPRSTILNCKPSTSKWTRGPVNIAARPYWVKSPAISKLAKISKSWMKIHRMWFLKARLASSSWSLKSIKKNLIWWNSWQLIKIVKIYANANLQSSKNWNSKMKSVNANKNWNSKMKRVNEKRRVFEPN